MKKIIYIFIFSILLIFTFSNNTSQASNGERYLYERIPLTYPGNTTAVLFEELTQTIRLRFVIESDLFINYKYMSDNINNNAFLILKELESGSINELIIGFYDPMFYGNELAVSFSIPKSYFTWYWEEYLQISEEEFYYDFREYLEIDLINYFNFYIRVDEETIEGIAYDNGYNEGYADGYAQGMQVSQSEAYNEGYRNGANQSFMGSLNKWIVPAIIIVMLLGGFFAIARKKRDGDI